MIKDFAKDFAKAVALRAVAIITGIALIAAYAHIKMELQKRAVSKANKAAIKAKLSVLEELTAAMQQDIATRLDGIADKPAADVNDVRNELLAKWTVEAERITNGSIRDIFLTMLHKSAHAAFPTAA